MYSALNICAEDIEQHHKLLMLLYVKLDHL
jgi:hypothetical protein